MIFSTQHQLNCLILFVFFGLLIGIIYCLFQIIFLKKYQKKLIKCIFFSVFCSIFCIFYVFLINFFNFGKFSIVLFFTYGFGFFWINKLCKNLVVIFENKWYTIINKIKTKIKASFKTKEKLKNDISTKN